MVKDGLIHILIINPNNPKVSTGKGASLGYFKSCLSVMLIMKFPSDSEAFVTFHNQDTNIKHKISTVDGVPPNNLPIGHPLP